MAASPKQNVIKIETPDDTDDQKGLEFCHTCLTACRITVLKDMTRLYSHNGSNEKYSEMLYHCFSFKMAGYPEEAAENIYMICETCIEKLRIAFNFRNCIEEAQQNIKQTLENIPIISESITHDHQYSKEADNNNFSPSEDNYEQETENTTEFKRDKLSITSDPGFFLQLDVRDIIDKKENSTDTNPYQVNITDLRNKSLTSYNSKRNHLINFHEVKSPRIKCEQCDLTFLRPSNVTEHVQKVHLDEGTAVCKIHNDSFSDIIDLTTDEKLEYIVPRKNPLRECVENILKMQAHSQPVETLTKIDLEIETTCEEGLAVANKSESDNDKIDSDDDYFLDKLASVSLSNDRKKTALERYQLRKTPKEPGKRRKRPKNHLYQLAPDQMQCTICEITFDTRWQLVLHMPTHFPNFTCEICGKVFALANQFEGHRLSHSNKIYECPLCPGKRYRYRSNFNYHNKNKHGSETVKINKCHLCGERFKNYQHKLKHLIDKHEQKPVIFKCHICNKIYKRRAVLSQHLRNVHLGERNHICKICNKGFFTGLYLRNHMLVHTGVRNFPCQICKKKFQRKYTLIEHMKIHTGEKKYICDICKKAFTQKCSLKGHIAGGNCQESKKKSR